MAVLNKIRQRSLFLIIVIALALFSFVLADLFRNSDALTSKGQNIIATINGKDITREAFMEKVELTQRQMGASGSSIQAMNRVWEQETRKAIMDSQFEKLGITVETEQMRDLLKTYLANTPDFQNEAGLFDENKLNEYIANLKATSQSGYAQWVNYENSIASSAIEQNYYNMVKAGIGGTVAEGELEHMLESEKVNIKYVQIPFSSIPDSTITITKTDISRYIDENKSDFEVEESRDIVYVQFKEEASKEDEDELKAKLIDLLNDKTEYNEVSNSTETITGFRNVSDYENYVNANSSIKYVDRYMLKTDLPIAFADSLFNLNVGEIYGPYKESGYIKISKAVAVAQLPDSVKARHILIPFVGAQSADPTKVTQTEVQAKKTADSVLTILKRNRSKFPELVTALSSDQGSIEKGGRYDWYPYGQMVPEFRDFTFEGKKGDMDVVKTAFGFHIIEIEGQKNNSKAMKIATIAEKIEPSQKTIDNTFNETSKFEIAVSKGNFEDVAKENNYDLRPVNSIKILQENIPGLNNQRAIVRWSFEDGTKVGDVKRFNYNGGYAVVQLRAKNKAGLMSTEDASITATPAIRKEKKAALIRNRISGKTLEEVSTAENQTIKVASALNMKNPTISGAGREPKVVGAAFGLAEGETSGLIDGNNGVYMIQVTQKIPAVKLDNYQAKANQITTQRNASINTTLYNALKEAAEIEDNRSSIY